MSKKNRNALSESLNRKRMKAINKMDERLHFIENHKDWYESGAADAQEKRIAELQNKPKFSSK